ncbi:MAG: YicC/YloC family endoribonuclease [Polyangiales bacterium]
MTGYGRGRAAVGAGFVSVEARALNHRFLEVRARLPQQLGEHVAALEEVARKRLERGRIELDTRTEGELGSEPLLDRARARAALSALRELRDEIGSSEPLPLSLLSVVPGLFRQDGPDSTAVRGALTLAATQACDALQAMRRTEGQALARDIGTRLGRVRELASALHGRAAELTTAHRDKLRARVTTLLAGSGVTLDHGRLEHEVALLADRSDVSEELTRLLSHCDQFATLLTLGDEPVGRRLEFLLQELGREVNTIGSKVGELGVTAHVLELKAELERVREQAQNVL